MTNLSGKFDELETQLADYQTAMMGVLNQILSALGSSPPPTNSTLDDVVSALNLINVNIQGLALNQLNTNTQLGLIRNILSASGNTLGQLSTNTHSILQFMLTNDWCCTGSTGDPITPPLGTNPSVDEEDRCKKAQLVADVWVAIIDRFDALLNQTGPTPIQTVYTQYDITVLGSAPKPSHSELSTLAYAINGARDAGLSNLGGLALSFKQSFRDILFSSVTAQEARQNIVSWSMGHFNDPFTRDIMALTINNGLLNLVYADGSRELDTTGYDGFLCSEITVSCISQTSIGGVSATPSNGYSPRYQLVIPGLDVVDTIEYAPGQFASYSEPVVMVSGIAGATIYQKVGRARVVYGNAGQNTTFASISTAGSYVQIPSGADYLIIDDFMAENTPGSGPFEVTFCTPEPI
jgi:hypothetical protein